MHIFYEHAYLISLLYQNKFVKMTSFLSNVLCLHLLNLWLSCVFYQGIYQYSNSGSILRNHCKYQVYKFIALHRSCVILYSCMFAVCSHAFDNY